MDSIEKTNVAETILAQLGGRRFMMFTGTGNAVALNTEDYKFGGLRLNLSRNKANANRLEITLCGDDTYKVYFYRVSISRKSFDVNISNEQVFEGVYCDQLTQIFESHTGLYTKF